MAPHEVTLLTVCPSPYAARVILALELKGVKYDSLEEDLSNKSQLLLQSNPVHKKIPVLIHNGKPLAESGIIVEYIDEEWPSPANGEQNFLPRDPYDRAVARFWANYIDNWLFPAIGSVMWGSTVEAREKGQARTIECLERLENAFVNASKSEGPFFAGGEFPGYVDIMMAPLVAWIQAIQTLREIHFFIEHKYPRFHKWMKAVEESPWSKCLPDTETILEFARRRINSKK